MNREAALRFLDAFNTHDLAKVEALLADDVRFISHRGTIEGREALMQLIADSGAPDSKLDALTVSLADRTLDEVGDTGST